MADEQAFRNKIQAFLKTRYMQRDDLTVSTVERLTGGYSYETYFLTLEWREGGETRSEVVVLSMEPECGVAPPYDVRPQYQVLQRVGKLGIPCPAVTLLESAGTVLGRRFFIMEKVEGINLDRYFPDHPDEQDSLRTQYAQIIARLHSLNWPELELTTLRFPEHDKAFATREIERYQAVMKANEFTPQPLMAEIFSWLKKNIPVSERTTLCHGDLKVGVAGNFFAHEGKISAVLDWELVSIGDPLSDLGYVSLVLQNQSFWNKEDFLHTYEALTGTVVNRDSLFFWEVFTYVKWIVMGYPGFKIGLSCSDLDMRQISANSAFLPWLKNAAAMKLGI
ncbi:MAG TPA: phosphotransferase family protein [Pseudomonas sp.]|nr:phosphotransferase family protein [Pseudomonas sp.]